MNLLGFHAFDVRYVFKPHTGQAIMHHVFIYGTLKRNYQNYHMISAHVTYVGRFRTQQDFPMVVGGRWFSPYLINEPGQGHQVIGEVFKVNDEGLHLLDELEGTHIADGYQRISTTADDTESSTLLHAWRYARVRGASERSHSDRM